MHVVTGSAGCKEGREKFIPHKPEWSAYRSSDYGYTRMKAYNQTHLYLEQVLYTMGKTNGKRIFVTIHLTIYR